MYRNRVHALPFARLLVLLTLALCLVTGQAMAQADPFAPMRGTATPGDKRAITLQASLTEGGGLMQDGLTWRVFTTVPDARGQLQLVASAEGGIQTLTLPVGDYFINCAFGRASTTRRVSVERTGGDDTLTFVLNAGGLVLNATLGDTLPADADKLRFAIYNDSGRQRELVIDDISPQTIVRLREGTYEIVSTYGDLNAETQARLKVRAGEITEATLKQHAAVVTLKLVAEAGGEALADTAWTVLGASGDVLTESGSVYPTMILAEGNYTVVARNKQDVYEKSFSVSPGQTQHVELLISEDAANVDDQDMSAETVD
ncbi:hypothetical protein [Martelella endophytica]|uniref:hypothetical protein n=1 Tax=Martelella endophytica TaxID=1486262 RepID=UPI0005F1930E|nr:hypothetical protein [Martelella endophytica]